MRKRILVMLAVIATVMSVAAVASAEDTLASVEGRGYIWAKGSGTAILDGHGRVQMAIDGDVVIYDFAGDAVVKIGPSFALHNSSGTGPFKVVEWEQGARRRDSLLGQ